MYFFGRSGIKRDEQEFQNVQKLLANPPVLRDFLQSEIALCDRLVDRALKKKPKGVRIEEVQKACAGVGV